MHGSFWTPEFHIVALFTECVDMRNCGSRSRTLVQRPGPLGLNGSLWQQANCGHLAAMQW
eukprot:366062-Chlamydomonas_euryale.AAC.14